MSSFSPHGSKFSSSLARYGLQKSSRDVECPYCGANASHRLIFPNGDSFDLDTDWRKVALRLWPFCVCKSCSRSFNDPEITIFEVMTS